MRHRDIWQYFILSGLLLTFSWVAIGDIYPLVFFAFVPVFFVTNDYILHQKNLKIIFLATYLAFFIWNLFTTYWIYFASPFGAVGAIVLNSLFSTCSYFLGVKISEKLYKRLHFLPLVSSWIAWEFLHQHWDLSWTWLTLGNVFANIPAMIQWYEWTGTLGGTFWILLINFLIFKFLFRWKRRIFQQVLVVFLVPVLFSLLIYNGRKSNLTEENPIHVLAVQPNLDPYTEKFGTQGHLLLMDSLQTIYHSFKNQKIDHVLLPETAVTEDENYSFDRENHLILKGLWEHQLEKSEHLKEVKELTKKYFPKAKILGGMDARSLITDGDTIGTEANKINIATHTPLYFKNHNAAFWISGNDKILSYNKMKLVVGVELFPFAPILEPIFSSWMANLGGTSGTLGRAKSPEVFSDENKKIKIAPIICYESVYGGFVAEYVKKGANLLYIITNDAWWGNSPGHKQHQAYARLRAIETRKWVVRAANTGISSFIDPLGMVYQSTQYGEKTAIHQQIYPNDIQTFYVRCKDYFAYLSLIFVALFLILGWTRDLLKMVKK